MRDNHTLKLLNECPDEKYRKVKSAASLLQVQITVYRFCHAKKITVFHILARFQLTRNERFLSQPAEIIV